MPEPKKQFKLDQEAKQDEENKDESAQEIKEDLFDVEEFCALSGLEKYHQTSLKSIYKNEKKTFKQWKEFLISNKYIDSNLFK